MRTSFSQARSAQARRRPSMSRARFILAAGVLLSLTGCAPAPVSLSTTPLAYSPEDYGARLKVWTREARLNSIEEMDNVLTATATYESVDFRSAYVARYSRDYQLKSDAQKQLLRRSLAEAREFHEFYVAFFAQQKAWAQLDDESPVWTTHLTDSTGQRTSPINLEKIKKPGALELAYFPYTNSWRTVYKISFPTKTPAGVPTIAPNAESFSLEFSGVKGTMSLDWAIAH